MYSALVRGEQLTLGTDFHKLCSKLNRVLLHHSAERGATTAQDQTLDAADAASICFAAMHLSRFRQQKKGGI